MEGNMDGFVDGETYASEDEWEIDLNYEFDAATFIDFSRNETGLETEEAEKWFDYADSYPSAPFMVRLNLEKIFASKQQCSSLKIEDVTNVNSVSSNNSDVGEVQTKKMEKPRSSTLMKPTLSLLAKQDKLQDVHLRHLVDRPNKALAKIDEKILPSPSRNLATKRQKLESGFLRKISQLKHQTLLLHKRVKKGESPSSSPHSSKLKVTIPKEPQLETMQRAQRQRSKITSDSSEDAKLKVHKFYSRRLNGKIHDVPSPKNSTQRSPENKIAKLKTVEKDMQQSSLDASSTSTDPSFTSTDESLSQDLPIESFSKLSIKSESGSNSISQARLNKYTAGLKESSPSSFKIDFWRYAEKPNQCAGDNMLLEIGHHGSNVSRSLDIH